VRCLSQVIYGLRTDSFLSEETPDDEDMLEGALALIYDEAHL
jgi:hypothetical protein